MKWERTGPVQLILLVATLAVILAFDQTRVENVELHNQRLDLLLQLERAEFLLDRDVDRVTTFRLVQFDPLVDHAKRIRALGRQLREIPQEPIRQERVDTYLAVMEEKLQLVERIKSQSAVVRNGLHYLPIAAVEMMRSNATVGRRVSALLNGLFHYQLFPSATESEAFAAAVTEIEDDAAAGGVLLENILLHLRTNLRYTRELTDLYDRYTVVPGSQRLDALYKDFTSAYAGEIARAEQFNLVLLLVVLLLLLGLAVALRNLFRSNRLIGRAHNQLRGAVESLSDAFALFAPDGRLILHNRKYAEFYPWLEEALRGPVSLEEIRRRHDAGDHFVAMGDAPPETPQPARGESRNFLEQLKNGRWYMAKDACTTTGELVCLRADVTESKRTELELRKLYRALEQSPSSVVITDTNGNIEYVNPRFEETTGYTAAEAIGQNPRILKSGDKSPEEYRELWQTIAAGKVWRGQFHNKRKDGGGYWESASISPVRDPAGNITHYIAIKEDITARKRAEDQLRLNATVFETTTEGIIVTDTQNRIKTVNPAFTRITGYQPEEVIGRNPSILKSGRHDRAFYQKMWDSLQRKGCWSGEVWNRHKNGSVFPEWLSLAAIKNDGGPVQEYVAVFSDITQRKQNEEQIRRQANYDALTGLPNRTLLLDRLSQALAGARREGRMVALLFGDLDRFKAVNDSMGHVIGDNLLQQVAERLRACVREADTVARFGGDEFVVILEDVKHADDAAEVAKKIIAHVDQPFTLGGREVFIGCSIGVTLFPDDANDASEMLRNADLAMYRAKSTGRNNYQFFTPLMNEQVHGRMELEQDLRQALDRNQLVLQYQPIVSLSHGGMVGIEALLYWHDPQRGLVTPDIFIPLAEEAGLIDSIGRWVLETACEQTAAWHNEGLELRLHVNLSSRQLTSGLKVDELEAVLERYGLKPGDLVLEISESLVRDGPDAALDWLELASSLGMGLAVDDFGTGYSSLGYLKRFPVDTLKIDGSFVSGLPDDSSDVALVKAMVAMAHSLNLQVVAEGVETVEQYTFLQNLGCGLAQGYLFSRPVEPWEIPELTRRLTVSVQA